MPMDQVSKLWQIENNLRFSNTCIKAVISCYFGKKKILSFEISCEEFL